MRLTVWLADEQGLVLVFTALALPLILLVGVFLLHTGEVYRRQAELQFMAQNTANSVLLPVGDRLKSQAEENYRATCEVDFPPSRCGSDHLFDFLNFSEAQTIINHPSTQAMVATEALNFITQADPRQRLGSGNLQLSFPHDYNGETSAIARVTLTERQTHWIGDFLKPENYQLEVVAESFLKLTNS